jgi:hypothetical protein
MVATMSRIGPLALRVLVLVLVPAAASAQLAPRPPVPEGDPFRTYGVSYEHTTLGTDWSVSGNVDTAQGKDAFTGNLLASSPGFHIVRGWLGRRRWLGPNLGVEALLSLGYGHAFERRSTATGSLGNYPLTSSFDLYDLQGLYRLFLFRRVVYVELGLLWQRVVASATVTAGATRIALGGSEDYIGGSAGLGAECPLSTTWRIGASLASAGFVKLPGPFPTRTQLRLYLTW